VPAIVLILLLALNPMALVCRAPDTLSLKFERKAVQGSSTEVAKGIAYYQSPQRVFIEVRDPIRQIMIIDGKVMLIYYPVEKRAFRIKAKHPIPMPFIQAILSAMKDDYGLTEMGYTLAKHEAKGDMLYTYWAPPSSLKKRLGEFILGMTNGLLTYAEARGPDGRIAARSFYRKHIELAGGCFPLEVHSEVYDGSSHMEEYVTYSEVEFNVSLPNRVVSFRLPDSMSVEEVEW
jgi:outer membrane lipoprotein-sorting protein